MAILEPFYKEIYDIIVDSCKEHILGMPEAKIYEQIKSEFQVSKKLKIRSKRAVIRFIGLSFILGYKFYTTEKYILTFNKSNKNIESDIDLFFN